MFANQEIRSKLKQELCKGCGVYLTAGTANSPTAAGAGQSKANQRLRMHINETILKVK